MKKRISLYLDVETILILKTLSVDSNPHVSQSSIVEHLINSTQDGYFEKDSNEKRSKKTSSKKEVN